MAPVRVSGCGVICAAAGRLAIAENANRNGTSRCSRPIEASRISRLQIRSPRQDDPERGSAAGGFDTDASAIRLDRPLRDRQAKPRAARLARAAFIDAIE